MPWKLRAEPKVQGIMPKLSGCNAPTARPCLAGRTRQQIKSLEVAFF
jgi:hypothetical protein